MPPRPLVPSSQSDGSMFPPEFLANQIRPEGRAMRPVKENVALTGLKAELQRNSMKAARAKATKMARKSLSAAPSLPEDATNSAGLPQPQAATRTFGSDSGLVSHAGLPTMTQPMPAVNVGPLTPQTSHWTMAQNPNYGFNHQGHDYMHQEARPAESGTTPSRTLQPIQDHTQHRGLIDELKDSNLNYNTLSIPRPAYSNNGNRTPDFALNIGTKNTLTDMTVLEPMYQEASWNNAIIDANQEKDLEEFDVEHNGVATAVPMGQGLQINGREVIFKSKMSKIATAACATTPEQDLLVKDEPPNAVNITKQSRTTRSISVFSADTQRIVRAACDLLRAHLTKVDPWPDTAKANSRGKSTGVDTYTSLSMDLWYEACSLLSIEDIDPDGGDELKRILERTPQFRGQVRDKASLLIVNAYNFVDIRLVGKKLTAAQHTDIAAKNRQMYVSIKDRFWFKDPTEKNQPDSMYRHPIIQHVFNIAWFGEGTYARSSYFADDVEVPLVTIAFILTAVENALDHWRTGHFHRVDFSCKEYHSCYQKHMRRLLLWKAFSAQEHCDQATDVQRSLLENARLSIEQENEKAAGGEEETEEDLLAMFMANRAA